MQSTVLEFGAHTANPRQFSAAETTYDGAVDGGRRRSPKTRVYHEDAIADSRRRRILESTTQDLARNYVITAWAVRKHLDFVADFTFQAATPDAGWNKYYEEWWREKCKKHNFDAASRHPHRRGVRLAEAGRTIGGDVFWMKLAPPVGNPLRGNIQAIESDRIFMPRGDLPKNANPDEWVNGVRCEPGTGRAVAYGVCKRVNKTGRKLERIVPARNIIPHAAYEFRYDQVRGISPIVAALNWYRDTQEGFEYALAKLKIGQLFGVQLTTEADSTGSAFGPAPRYDEGDDEIEADADESTTNTAAATAPPIQLGKGPFVAELNPGEKAEVIESRTPSAETVEFLKLMLLIVLRALDIPFSFLDESFTNFYGSRGGLIQYLHACNTKVLDLIDFLDEHHAWRAGLAIADGDLELPSGKDFSFLKWEFIPGGVPWWDPAKEARGQAMAIAMGASSPIRTCREIGTNFFRNIDETAIAMDYAKSKGVPLTFADSTAFAPSITVEAGNEN